jgi:hypothetical protein
MDGAELPHNTRMTFPLPKSAAHTRELLKELHGLIKIAYTWTLREIDGQEKREQLIELTVSICAIHL